jgi:hypothetical protein
MTICAQILHRKLNTVGGTGHIRRCIHNLPHRLPSFSGIDHYNIVVQLDIDIIPHIGIIANIIFKGAGHSCRRPSYSVVCTRISQQCEEEIKFQEQVRDEIQFRHEPNVTIIPVKTKIHLVLTVLPVSSGFPFSRE